MNPKNMRFFALITRYLNYQNRINDIIMRINESNIRMIYAEIRISGLFKRTIASTIRTLVSIP